jgi:hypothetical protein
VTQLVDVPHSIVLTDTQGSQSQSWTVQCEILQQHLLEVLPHGEDPVPPQLDNGQPPLVDFFGLGQLGASPFLHHHEHENEDQELVGWDDWAQQNPDAAPAAIQEEDQFVQVDNIDQVPMPDLNLVPFAEMEEPDDEVDQLVVVPDLNFAPVHGQFQNVAMGTAPPQAPLSMELRSFTQDNSVSTQSSEQQLEAPDIVLALQAEPMDFLPLEINSNDLNVVESFEDGSVSVDGTIIPFTRIPLNNGPSEDDSLNNTTGEGSSNLNQLRGHNGSSS